MTKWYLILLLAWNAALADDGIDDYIDKPSLEDPVSKMPPEISRFRLHFENARIGSRETGKNGITELIAEIYLAQLDKLDSKRMEEAKLARKNDEFDKVPADDGFVSLPEK